MENFTVHAKASTSTVSFVTIFSDINTQLKKKKLQREMDTTKIFISRVPDCLLETDIKKFSHQKVKKEFNIYMESFFEEITSNLPEVNLNAFLENSKNIEFRMLNHAFSNKNSLADFYIKPTKEGHKAIITFYTNDIKNLIWHELLHIASARLFIDYEFTGFTQHCFGDIFYNIGHGLNEGYTEVLSERYFKRYGASANSYMLLQNIAKILEMIVEKTNMEQWYFESNLFALGQTLKQYDDEQTILSTIKKIDTINKYYVKPHYIDLVEKIYQEVLYTLLSWYIKKQLSQNNNSIEPKVYELLKQNIKIQDKIVKGLTNDEIDNYISSFLNNNHNNPEVKKI